MISPEKELTVKSEPNGVASTPDVPLCVDLDGTLLRTDTLHEGILLMLKVQPLLLFKLPLWLMRGRAHLKREVTRRTHLDIETLPVNEEFQRYLEAQHAEGRRIVLVTAADTGLAHAVADRFGIFSDVMSSDGSRNLAGEQKAKVLSERFGRQQFDYAGNADADLAVWSAARHAIVVGTNESVLERAKKTATIEQAFVRPEDQVRLLCRAMRPHQWAKNTLLFLPLLGAHAWMNLPKVQAVVIAFVAFSLCASSVYILNDLLDLSSDRRHPNKANRPFASGRLPVSWGLALFPVLLIAAVCIAGFLPSTFMATFYVYYLVTVSYSLRLKQFAIVDVFVLVALYGLRVIAGGVAAQVNVSDWLLVFCLFLFLSLAFAKRFIEIRTFQNQSNRAIAGRGYRAGDAEMIAKMGVASGYIAVVILALYVTSPDVKALYSKPVNLLLACPFLLYWISRVWLRAERGQLNDDPIVFAITDKQSWIIALGTALSVFIAGPK